MVELSLEVPDIVRSPVGTDSPNLCEVIFMVGTEGKIAELWADIEEKIKDRTRDNTRIVFNDLFWWILFTNNLPATKISLTIYYKFIGIILQIYPKIDISKYLFAKELIDDLTILKL